MLRPHHIDNIVSEITGVSVKLIHSHRGSDPVCDARNMAMLKCKQWLKTSNVKLTKQYGKDSRGTIISDLKTARDMIETDKEYREKSEDIDKKVRAKIAELKTRQQLYDLHYRLRKMGIPVIVRYKTISVDSQYREKIEKSRTMKLIKQHGYVIQYSIF
jgi:hypothetical protein